MFYWRCSFVTMRRRGGWGGAIILFIWTNVLYGWPRTKWMILNPSHPVHFQNCTKIKINFQFLLSHFFVLPQKVLWRPLRPSLSGIGAGRVNKDLYNIFRIAKNDLKKVWNYFLNGSVNSNHFGPMLPFILLLSSIL